MVERSDSPNRLVLYQSWLTQFTFQATVGSVPFRTEAYLLKTRLLGAA